MFKSLIILAVTMITQVSTAPASGNIKTIDGTVTAHDSEYTYIDTVDGNGWVIDHSPALLVNGNITITFDNMGTVNIYDDEIIELFVNDIK